LAPSSAATYYDLVRVRVTVTVRVRVRVRLG